MQKIVYLDTETTGLPDEFGGLEKQPHLISVSIISEFYDPKTGERLPIEEYEVYSKDSKPFLSDHAREVNGITEEFLDEVGISRDEVHARILQSLEGASVIICHNTKFDIQILWYEAMRTQNKDLLKLICTTRNFCTSVNSRTYGINKKPNAKHMKLVEMYVAMFGKEFDGQHNALADTQALRDCTYKLIELGELTKERILATPRYAYISLYEEPDGRKVFEVSKKCVNNIYPPKTMKIYYNNVNEIIRESIEFLDDCIIFFFTDKTQMELYIRYSNISEHKTKYGFRLATFLKYDPMTATEMLSKHQDEGGRLKTGLTLLKDNGFFYR